MSRIAAALAERLGAALARGSTVATAESCTGGLVAGAITDVAGSSTWFDRGFVTYSNAAKETMLDVPRALVEEHGAVSEEVARAMARGAIARSEADLAVAITGIAGPGGGTPRKPVGLVWFAFATRSGTLESMARRFDGDRASVREAAVVFALEGLVRIASAR